MKRRNGLLLFVAALATSAPLSAQPQITADRVHAIRSFAGSCSRTAVSACDTETFGALESGDCLFDDGSRFDTFTFAGQAGQEIEVMVRPLTESYSRPWIALVPPNGDPSAPPVISGGAGGATITYRLTSTGTWSIGVSSDDVFAGGAYVLHVYCYASDPTVPQSCVYQNLLCGQEGAWKLTADSCKFTGAPKVYAGWWVYGKAGDFLQFEQHSTSFEPLFGIYHDGQLLKSSTRDSIVKASMTYVVPETGWYYFVTTTVEEGKGGDFFVSLKCNISGCTFPYLLSDPPQTIVKYGERATIPFAFDAVGGASAALREDMEIVATSTSKMITTPPITGSHTYFLELDNACGGWTSSPFVVAPEAARRRAVRH